MDTTSKFKKWTIALLTTFLSILVILGIAFLPRKSVQTAAVEQNAQNITQATFLEQQDIDDNIRLYWRHGSGKNPTTSQLQKLESNFSADKLSAVTGDVWYYLDRDITTNIKDITLSQTSYTNIRILLNGYTISNNFSIKVTSSKVQVAFFDKIPLLNGVGYNYNPNPIRYYKYAGNDSHADHARNAASTYSDYTTSVPSNSYDVTAAPTFKKNTYIRVVGSCFGANALAAQTDFSVLCRTQGTARAFGINVVGNRTTSAWGIFALDTFSLIDIIQCNIIGNTGLFWAAVGSYDYENKYINRLTIVCSKIYSNNPAEVDYYGVNPANPELLYENDIFLHFNESFTSFKNNIGVITETRNFHSSNINSISLKDVAFPVGHQYFSQFRVVTLTDLIGKIDNITGTIELFGYTLLQYYGKSPQLNFIVHSSAPIYSHMPPVKDVVYLDIAGNAVVKGILVSGVAQILTDRIGTLTTVPNARVYRTSFWEDQAHWLGFTLLGRDAFVSVQGTVELLDVRENTYLGPGSIFTVERNIADDALVTASLEYTTKMYNGTFLTPKVTVQKVSGEALVEGRDYTVRYEKNIYVGTASVVIIGKGDYVGSKTLTFEITHADINTMQVTLAYTNLVYTGEALTPKVTVKTPDGVILVDGVDYIVEYTNNINVGTATVTITGQGNLVATKVLHFTILSPKMDIANTIMTLAQKEVGYTGEALTPEVTVTTADGIILVNGVDYTVVYANNVNIGIATVTITGIDNYEGSRILTFKIVKGDTPVCNLTSLDVKGGTTLKDYAKYLPENWVWANPDLAIDENLQSAEAVYIGADKDCYNNITVSIELNYIKAPTLMPTPDNGNTNGVNISSSNNNGTSRAIIIGSSSTVGFVFIVLLVLLIIYLTKKRQKQKQYIKQLQAACNTENLKKPTPKN